MHRTRHIAALIVLALSLMTVSACRHRHHNHEEISLQDAQRRASDRVAWVLDDLDATDQQEARITTLVRELVAEGYPLRELRKPAREALLRELLSGKPEPGAVHGTVDGVAAPLTAFAHKAATTALTAHGVLDAKQREESAEEWEERAADRRSIRDREWMLDAGLERGLNRIDASEAQFKLVFSLKDELLKDVEGLEAVRDAASGALIAQLRSDTPDARLIHATVDKAAGALTAFAHKAADAAVTVSRTLSEEQRRVILAELKDRK